MLRAFTRVLAFWRGGAGTRPMIRGAPTWWTITPRRATPSTSPMAREARMSTPARVARPAGALPCTTSCVAVFLAVLSEFCQRGPCAGRRDPVLGSGAFQV